MEPILMFMNKRFGSVLGIALALLLVALATGAAWLMDGDYSLASQAMVYLLAVVFAAFFLGAPSSIATAVFAVFALNFFYIPPRYTFSVEGPEYLIDLLALLVVSLVVSGLAARLRAETEKARLGERRAQETHALAELIGGAGREQDLLGRAVGALLKAFGASCCIVLRRTDGAGPVRAVQAPEAAAMDVDLDAAQWVIENQVTIGAGTGYWPQLTSWYIPLPAPDQGLGTVVVAAGEQVPGRADDDRRHAEALARQIAVAIQRARLGEKAARAAREVESESIRSALLASISHDFRTPLAVIIGAASTLSTQSGPMPKGQREALLATIENEAAQMSAMAENILQLARLSSGVLSLRCDWESVEEIVGSVIARFRRRGMDRQLKASVPGDLPLIRADAVLLSQVLDNLIDNAFKHSSGDSKIEVDVRLREKTLGIAVKDRGTGLEGDPNRLFEKFYRGHAETSEGGVGLGLAICKAVIEAHGGRISAHNRPGGGAEFRIALPLSEMVPTVAPSVPEAAS
jgi:two-component system, OmpR family, sensor histidine kinase KdpD